MSTENTIANTKGFVKGVVQGILEAMTEAQKSYKNCSRIDQKKTTIEFNIFYDNQGNLVLSHSNLKTPTPNVTSVKFSLDIPIPFPEEKS